MKYQIFWILILLAGFSCTNPEVNFPDEDPKKETKKTDMPVYDAPTLLVYGKNLEPAVFFHLFALAQANGAKESVFLYSGEDEKTLLAALKKLRQTYGKPPVFIGVGCDPALYWPQIREELKKAVFMGCTAIPEEDPEVEFLVLPEKKTVQKTEPDSSDAQEEKTEPLSAEKSESVESSDAGAQEPPFNLRQEMKNLALLSRILNFASGKKLAQTSAARQELLILKGRALSGSRISVISFLESGKEKEAPPVMAQKSGGFSALVIDSTKSFEIQVQKESVLWRAVFSGLVSSCPFFELFPPEGDMEIRSFFTPIALDALPLPEGVEIPEETRKVSPKIYRAVFQQAETAGILFSENEVRISFAGEVSGTFKWQEKEFVLKPQRVLFLLD